MVEPLHGVRLFPEFVPLTSRWFAVRPELVLCAVVCLFEIKYRGDLGHFMNLVSEKRSFFYSPPLFFLF